MANLEKHKKNPVNEWLDPEESSIPAQSRSSHVLGAYIKISKATSRKVRRMAPAPAAAKPDPALAREPAPPQKSQEKHSQSTSPDHLRKSSRITRLRAPAYRAGKRS